ncbi:MAG: AAA family ATPase [Prochloron sp. SP5CPC1]|nr:AAA family ATPase [Candidatus Paraprochloron terpiosi SP5CPC1]
MKLISIQLCNFRQFYDKTPEITLAAGERNTTIIHGNNGAGKTTILNAFTWVLYEKFTAAFASPDLLVNKRAITEANFGTSVDCWVEIKFEHNNKRYQVKRLCSAYRDKNDNIQYSKNELRMLVAGDEGKWVLPPEQPTDIIEKILPTSLHQYFFFDGERIEHIFRYGEKNSIAEDTKELIGVKVLERSMDHLKKAKRNLQEELKAIGDAATKKLLRKQKEIEKERESLQQRLSAIAVELQQTEEEKKAITNRLLELSGLEELKQLKHKLTEQEQSVRQNLLNSNKNLRNVISRRGYGVFIADVVVRFRALVNELRAKGEFPSGIKRQFVQELLATHSCICGTKLTEGGKAYHKVQGWMNRAGMAELEESAIRMEARVGELEKQVPEFWQEVDREQGNIKQWREELAEIENELDEIKDKFRNSPDEDLQKLQTALDKSEEKIKELTLEQGGIQEKLATFTKEIEAIAKDISKHKMKEGKQVLAQRRIKATEDAIARIIEVRGRLEKQFRSSLEKRVQEIFNHISFTPYIPRISDKYELTLVENTSGIAVSVAASTGENQILSLSFIGGIMDRVREWSQKNTLMGPDSSTFPIVMDSPFGSLDEIYRRQVAQCIPQLANQLVILATKTQWRGEVEREITPYIGKQYVLTYNSPKSDCEEDIIELGGKIYPLVKLSPNKFEYTEIIEVEA